MADTQVADLETGPPPARRWRWALAAVGIVAVALVATAVTVAESSSTGSPHRSTRVVTVPAIQAVSSAVGTTVAAQRWDFTFADSFQPAPGKPPIPEAASSGHGTVNLDPYAMVAVDNDPTLGVITTMRNGSLIWEFGGGNYGATPGNGASGAPIAGFASLVEGSLGPEDGAVAMLGLASSTGHSNLVQAAMSGATRLGTGTVDGTAVTFYRVSVDPTRLAAAPGITPEEATAVTDALRLLAQDGFQTMTDTVAVDGSGLIRQDDEVVTFADGAVATLHSTMSNFGCAATVVLPGQQPPTTPGPCGTPPATAP